MHRKVISPYILIKVPKEDETSMREMENGIWLHPSFVWMTRNTQCGIIEHISPDAQKELPHAKVGDMAIVHHFVQGSFAKSDTQREFLVDEDENFNYYQVTAKEYNGQNNQCYGTYDGTNIYPHKDYVFIEKETEIKEGWYQTEEQILERLEKIKADIMELTKTKPNREIIERVHKLEYEQFQINEKLHKKEYLPYKIIASSIPSVKNNDVVFMLNISTRTEIQFLGITYKVAESKYIGAV